MDPLRTCLEEPLDGLLPDRRWALAVGAVLLAAAVASVVRALGGPSDVEGFLTASRALLETGQVPDLKGIERYPPTFPLVLAPLGALPLGLGAALWALLNLAALVRLPALLHRLGGPPPAGQRTAWLVLLPLALDNLMLGQHGPLLLWLVCRALLLARRGGTASAAASTTASGGALLGLAACLKVFPLALVVVPLTLARRRFTFLTGGLTVIVATMLVMVLALGEDETARAHRRWVATLAEEQTPWALVESNRSLRYNNQALGVVLARTFGDIAPRDPEGAVRLASLPLVTVWRAWAVTLALLVVTGLMALAHLVRHRRPDAWLRLLALASLGMLFVSPLVWTHYFLWIAPALVAAAHRPRLLARGGLVFVLALAITPLRGLGLHLLAAMGLYLVLVHDVLRPVAASRPHGARASREAVATPHTSS